MSKSIEIELEKLQADLRAVFEKHNMPIVKHSVEAVYSPSFYYDGHLVQVLNVRFETAVVEKHLVVNEYDTENKANKTE